MNDDAQANLDLVCILDGGVCGVAHHGYTTNAVSRFIDSNNIDKFASVADSLADRAVGESYAALVPCQSQDMACAKTFVDTFGLRAFRRPLTTEETARYLTLFDPGVTGGDFKVGVSLVIRAMLVSPYFLMRSEMGMETGPGRFTLTPFEVASALSYTYWGTLGQAIKFHRRRARLYQRSSCGSAVHVSLAASHHHCQEDGHASAGGLLRRLQRPASAGSAVFGHHLTVSMTPVGVGPWITWSTARQRLRVSTASGSRWPTSVRPA